MASQPNVIVVNPPNDESIPPQESAGESAETLRLAQLAGQAVESSRQSAEATATLRAELESERESRRALEARVTELVTALEEEEGDQEEVTVIAPPPPPPPPEPETPAPPKKKKGLFERMCFGESE